MAVLVDDLVTLGTEEPYRMFTSRAEHRLLLREDNADARLSREGYERGLLCQRDWEEFNSKIDKAGILINSLENININSGEGSGRGIRSLAEELRKPGTSIDLLRKDLSHSNPEGARLLENVLEECDMATINTVEADVKYAGYIKRQKILAERAGKLDSIRLPLDMDYAKVAGLSREVQEKLEKARPESLGKASRISGVTPAAVACLEIHLRKLAHLGKQKLSANQQS